MAAVYERIFVISDVAEVHKGYLRVFDLIAEISAKQRRVKSPAIPAIEALERQALRSYADFNRGLDAAARMAAATATKAMIERLHATARRPDTGNRPQLRDLLTAHPLAVGPVATGVVGVAPHSVLDVVPYWRTQEDGYAGNVGRRLQGFFYDAGGGGPSGQGPRGRYAPDPQYRGGGGPHPIFRTGPGPGMVITAPIVARHFIRDGANVALTEWRLNIRKTQARAVRDLGKLL